MVQVLQAHQKPRKPSFSESLRLNEITENFGTGMGQSLAEEVDLKRQEKIKRLGAELEGRESAAKRQHEMDYLEREYELKGRPDQMGALEDQKTYSTIKQHWGDKAADIYQAATEGGKTKILQHLLEAGQRGQKIDDILPNLEEANKGVSEAKDFDKGLTPKERTERQEKRYSVNLPLYQESQKRREALEAESDKLDILDELSPQISGMTRLNINPQSGELLIPAAASPEAQRYVKTINDYTTLAKDTYGSRVTNFDLSQFMKRLPSLANSLDAREDIIKQMKIINDVNKLKEQSVQDVIDEHGGIRNVDFDVAERIAEKRIKGDVNGLKAQFKTIDRKLDREYQQKIKEKKKAAPKGFVYMEIDGSFGYVPEKEVKKALSEGAKLP